MKQLFLSYFFIIAWIFSAHAVEVPGSSGQERPSAQDLIARSAIPGSPVARLKEELSEKNYAENEPSLISPKKLLLLAALGVGGYFSQTIADKIIPNKLIKTSVGSLESRHLVAFGLDLANTTALYSYYNGRCNLAICKYALKEVVADKFFYGAKHCIDTTINGVNMIGMLPSFAHSKGYILIGGWQRFMLNAPLYWFKPSLLLQ